jgi:hypothetical protein
MQQFAYGTTYPINTLPDDLGDESIPARDKWAIRDAMFWNDCQGWWHEHIADYWRGHMLRGDHVARFWAPQPPDPMTRDEILAERGMGICPRCDIAIDVGAQCSCTP